MEKDVSVYIKHILDAIILIEETVAGLDYKTFLEVDTINNTVVRQLTVIGEAAARLPASYRESKPEILWPKVIGARNAIVHDYFDIKYEVVWKIVEDDLPPLKKALLLSLKNDFKEEINLKSFGIEE